MAFSPNGSILAVEYDRTVTLWDVASRTRVGELTDHQDRVQALAFSPNGQLLATGGYDKSIILWDVAQRARVATLAGHTDWVDSLAFNADGSLLASGSRDDTVRLWDVARRVNLGSITAHTFGVNGVAFTPDGTLVSSSKGTFTPDRRIIVLPTDPESWRQRLCDAVGRDFTEQERADLGLPADLLVCA
jgi:WD40 repeat protein